MMDLGTEPIHPYQCRKKCKCSFEYNLFSSVVIQAFAQLSAYNMMMMAPAMGASEADSRGGTTLLLGPGAHWKPGYVALPASPAVHHVRVASEDQFQSSAAFVHRPSMYDERAIGI